MYEKLKADVAFMNGEYESAADMFLEGAREGDSLAAFNYGYCLLKGLGREYNPTEAKSFFSFAANLEGGAASYNLAMLYLHGEGVAQDFALALKHMRISAENGCIEAQLYMGMACTLGCMFEPDVIGICLIPYHKPEYRDIRTPLLSGYVPDFDEEDMRFAVLRADARAAFEWFRLAARHDPTYVEELSAKGKYLYAKCFIDGLGTDFDRAKGTRLMLVAGKSGSSEAVMFLKENGVTPEMIYALANKNKSKGN
jgi:TPR repeat protein